MSGFDLPPMVGSRLLPRLIGEGPRPQPAAGGLQEGGAEVTGSAFGNALAEQLGRVSSLQADVTRDTEAMAMGRSVGVDKLMMSIGKSEVAFNLMLEVRNKLVDAWEKLSRSVV
jgi:flagellar hook-basal body complex protein FliE